MIREDAERLKKKLKSAFPEISFAPIKTLEVLRGRSSPFVHIRMSCDNLVIPFHRRIFSRTIRTDQNRNLLQEATKEIKVWQQQLLSYEDHKPINLIQLKLLCDRVLEEGISGYSSFTKDEVIYVMNWAKVTLDEETGILEAHTYLEVEEEFGEVPDERHFVEIWSSENTVREANLLAHRLLETWEKHQDIMEGVDLGDEDEDEDEEGNTDD